MSIVTGPMEIGESVCIKPSLPKKQAALSRNPLQRQAKRGWRLARRCDTGAAMTDRTVALLVAAGQGSRAGGDIAKQFRLTGGRPGLPHPDPPLSLHPAIDPLILSSVPGQD